MGKLYVGNSGSTPAIIKVEEVPKTKFGASVDTWLSDVDENGVLQKTTWTGALNFAGIKKIASRALVYTFYENVGLMSVDLSSLQTVERYGLFYTFYSCKGLTSVGLGSLQSVNDSGMDHTFSFCSNLMSVDLSSLQSVEMNGLYYTFSDCSNLTGVDLNSLQSVGSNSLICAFSSCKKLNLISFPSLTDVQANSFGASIYAYAFRDCTALTEIHFRADMQAEIEAMSGYSSKWGATNATIYFDL